TEELHVPKVLIHHLCREGDPVVDERWPLESSLEHLVVILGKRGGGIDHGAVIEDMVPIARARGNPARPGHLVAELNVRTIGPASAGEEAAINESSSVRYDRQLSDDAWRPLRRLRRWRSLSRRVLRGRVRSGKDHQCHRDP